LRGEILHYGGFPDTGIAADFDVTPLIQSRANRGHPFFARQSDTRQAIAYVGECMLRSLFQR
jgi:hypothetical protein